jgi:hypothetical protein
LPHFPHFFCGGACDPSARSLHWVHLADTHTNLAPQPREHRLLELRLAVTPPSATVQLNRHSPPRLRNRLAADIARGKLESGRPTASRWGRSRGLPASKSRKPGTTHRTRSLPPQLVTTLSRPCQVVVKVADSPARALWGCRLLRLQRGAFGGQNTQPNPQSKRGEALLPSTCPTAPSRVGVEPFSLLSCRWPVRIEGAPTECKSRPRRRSPTRQQKLNFAIES